MSSQAQSSTSNPIVIASQVVGEVVGDGQFPYRAPARGDQMNRDKGGKEEEDEVHCMYEYLHKI